MGNKQKFGVHGATTWYDPIGETTPAFYQVRDKPYFCVCCKKPILLNTPVALLANNFSLFPNVVIHQSCFKGEETITEVFQDYVAWKQAQSRYKHWQ